MIDELAATSKQVGLELIDMSDTLTSEMQTWGDVLAQNPESTTATISAGFVTKPTAKPGRELTIDVQIPPDKKAMLRTWAIETKIGDDQQEYFNNIQLTFEVDNQQVRDLVAKGRAITREDIRRLLKDQTSRLARITVSNKSGGDGTKQTHGERYDFTIPELNQHPDEVAKVDKALQTVQQILKQSVANSLH
ncbi:MAG TPA: hypothetical protein VM581_01305 [Magnetospirillaceae bacterium]|nr:hypothetical protein [Magnetospirillaceae bacterium]